MKKAFLCKSNTGLSILAEYLYNYYYGPEKALSARLENLNTNKSASPDSIIEESLRELNLVINNFSITELDKLISSEVDLFIIVDNTPLPEQLINKNVIHWNFNYSPNFTLNEVNSIRNKIARWVQNIV